MLKTGVFIDQAAKHRKCVFTTAGVPTYVAVQVFVHMQFCSVPAATMIFQTHQFLFLPSINFLTLLDHKESSWQLGSNILQKANKLLKLSQKEEILMVKTRFYLLLFYILSVFLLGA